MMVSKFGNFKQWHLDYDVLTTTFSTAAAIIADDMRCLACHFASTDTDFMHIPVATIRFPYSHLKKAAILT
jgi:hypothetical protein